MAANEIGWRFSGTSKWRVWGWKDVDLYNKISFSPFFSHSIADKLPSSSISTSYDSFSLRFNKHSRTHINTLFLFSSHTNCLHNNLLAVSLTHPIWLSHLVKSTFFQSSLESAHNFCILSLQRERKKHTAQRNLYDNITMISHKAIVQNIKLSTKQPITPNLPYSVLKNISLCKYFIPV